MSSLNIPLEPTIYCTRGEQANHYGTDVVLLINVTAWIYFDEETGELSTFYWIPKFQKNQYIDRYIPGSSTCSTKELSITMTKILHAVKGGLLSYCDKVYSRGNINQKPLFWFRTNQYLLFLRNATGLARSNKYQFNSPWFDPTGARTHDLLHSRRAG
jgi:hypothetical protein